MHLLCRYCAETARPACPACGRPWRALYFVRLSGVGLFLGADAGRRVQSRRWDGLRCGVGDDDTRGVIMHAIY